VVSGFIFGLFFISGFAGFLPVVAGGDWDKWLIISVFFGIAGWLLCFLLGVILSVCCVLFFFVSKRKEPKEKEIFCQSLR